MPFGPTGQVHGPWAQLKGTKRHKNGPNMDFEFFMKTYIFTHIDADIICFLYFFQKSIFRLFLGLERKKNGQIWTSKAENVSKYRFPE